jgi:hypothetical protein
VPRRLPPSTAPAIRQGLTDATAGPWTTQTTSKPARRPSGDARAIPAARGAQRGPADRPAGCGRLGRRPDRLACQTSNRTAAGGARIDATDGSKAAIPSRRCPIGFNMIGNGGDGTDGERTAGSGRWSSLPRHGLVPCPAAWPWTSTPATVQPQHGRTVSDCSTTSVGSVATGDTSEHNKKMIAPGHATAGRRRGTTGRHRFENGTPWVPRRLQNFAHHPTRGRLPRLRLSRFDRTRKSMLIWVASVRETSSLLESRAESTERVQYNILERRVDCDERTESPVSTPCE